MLRQADNGHGDDGRDQLKLARPRHHPVDQVPEDDVCLGGLVERLGERLLLNLVQMIVTERGDLPGHIDKRDKARAHCHCDGLAGWLLLRFRLGIRHGLPPRESYQPGIA